MGRKCLAGWWSPGLSRSAQFWPVSRMTGWTKTNNVDGDARTLTMAVGMELVWRAIDNPQRVSWLSNGAQGHGLTVTGLGLLWSYDCIWFKFSHLYEFHLWLIDIDWSSDSEMYKSISPGWLQPDQLDSVSISHSFYNHFVASQNEPMSGRGRSEKVKKKFRLNSMRFWTALITDVESNKTRRTLD